MCEGLLFTICLQSDTHTHTFLHAALVTPHTGSGDTHTRKLFLNHAATVTPPSALYQDSETCRKEELEKTTLSHTLTHSDTLSHTLTQKLVLFQTCISGSGDKSFL